MEKGETASSAAGRAAIYAAIALLTEAVYAQTRNFAFVSIDDPGYVYENPRVLAGLSRNGLLWAFTTFHKANWHPLTWLSLMLDATVGGGGPRVFHLVNVAFHTVNALLLLLFLERTTGSLRRSAFDAAAHNNLGVLLMREGRAAEALAHFEQAARLDPANEGARRYLERSRALVNPQQP